MTSQMSDMQHEVDDKLMTEQALKAAEQARKQVCLLLNGITISALVHQYKVTSCWLGIAALCAVCEGSGDLFMSGLQLCALVWCILCSMKQRQC